MRALRQFIINGCIMAAASFLLRGIGVAWGAFCSARLGADGMGLYTLIMSVYGLTVTVASSGVNLAALRMCAEAVGRGEDRALTASLRRCLLYAGICGCTAWLLLFFGADYVAIQWLGDARCSLSLRLLAISMPFIALSNVLYGYFTAVRRVSKSAAAQIFEQIFKIAVTGWLMLVLMPDDIGIEYACAALVGGGAAAECASFVVSLLLYLSDRRHHRTHDTAVSVDGRLLTRELFGITIPVAAAAWVRSGLTTLEHVLIPRGLRANPITADTALASYGVLCGMAMPVVMFPTALLYSFTGLLVPEFAQAKARGDERHIGYMITRTLALTLIFAVGCAGVTAYFSNELGQLIYANADAGRFIGVMAPLIPLMYLDHTVDAILKGLGEQLYSMKVNILDAAICAFLVWILCPRIGIWGYVVTIYLSETVNASLSLARLCKAARFGASVGKGIVKPLLCIIGAAAILRLLPFAAESWTGVLIGCTAAVFVYFLLLIGTGAVSRRDLIWAAGVMKK